jgi:hypothetical protein
MAGFQVIMYGRFWVFTEALRFDGTKRFNLISNKFVGSLQIASGSAIGQVMAQLIAATAPNCNIPVTDGSGRRINEPLQQRPTMPVAPLSQ